MRASKAIFVRHNFYRAFKIAALSIFILIVTLYSHVTDAQDFSSTEVEFNFENYKPIAEWGFEPLGPTMAYLDEIDLSKKDGLYIFRLKILDNGFWPGTYPSFGFGHIPLASTDRHILGYAPGEWGYLGSGRKVTNSTPEEWGDPVVDVNDEIGITLDPQTMEVRFYTKRKNEDHFTLAGNGGAFTITEPPAGKALRPAVAIYSFRGCTIEIVQSEFIRHNTAPRVSDVSFSGNMKVGQVLTGTYDYADDENDPESGSTFQWYRSDDDQGTNKTAIAGATTAEYTLTNNDLNKYVSFEVTPSDGIEFGETLSNSPQGPVIEPVTTVTSIVRQSPTDQTVSASEVTFRVTFGDNVANVTADDFSLSSTVGGSIASVTAVRASVYDVVVNGINNVDGTLSLKIKGVDGTAGINDIQKVSYDTNTKTISQSLSDDYLDQSKLGQTFTATTNNLLTAFTIYPKSGVYSFSGTADLKIYSGNELDGNATLIRSQTIDLNSSTSSVGQTIELASPVTLTQNQVYSLVMENFSGSGSHALGSSTSGDYDGGRVIFTGTSTGSHTDFDLKFDIYEGIASLGTALQTDAPQTNESYTLEKANLAPNANNVSFTGALKVGKTLTGSYDYTDSEDDAESGTTFQWYRSDDDQGTNKMVIAGATASTYTLANDDSGKYISFEVTPNDGNSAGVAVESELKGAVINLSGQLEIPNQDGSYDGSRGLWFIAPVDFIITGLRVPTTASTAAQSIQVVKIGGGVQLVQDTQNFETLAYHPNVNGTSIIDVNIPVQKGDSIGILGTRGTTTSYGPSPYTSTIAGVNVQLSRINSSSGHISSSQATEIRIFDQYQLGRVELYYSLNKPPVASNVTLTGNLEVGELLTGSYDYADEDDDEEKGTTFQWYRSDNDQGANKEAISGANGLTYVLTEADQDHYISFEVTPNDGISDGDAVESTRSAFDLSAPEMISATFDSHTQITLSFNEIVQTNGANPSDFVVSDEQNNAFAVTSQQDGSSNDNDITLTFEDLSSAIGHLTISYTNNHDEITDLAGLSLETSDIVLAAPALSSIVRSSPSTASTNANTVTFRATFNQGVRYVDASDFVLNSDVGGSINSVTPVSNSVYDIDVNGITDADGNVGLELKGVDGASGANNIRGFLYEESLKVNLSAINDYLNQTKIGQTFTATASNYLSKVTFFMKDGNHSFAGAADLKVYSGDESEGGATELLSQTVSISNSTSDEGQTFVFDNPPMLTAGETYSIVLNNFTGTGNYALASTTSGSYNEGHVIFTGYIPANHGNFDLKIKIYEKQLIDGLGIAFTPDADYEDYIIDNTAPTLVSATKDSNTQITLTFSEQVQINEADAGNFTVQDGNSNSFNVLSLNDGTAQDNQLILGFTDLSPASAKITITYNPTSGNISDFGGNNLAADATGVEILLDVTAPSGYSVSLDDDLINATEAANATFTFANAEVGATYNYTVSSNGGGADVTGSGTIASATDQITLADLSGLNDGVLTLSVKLTDPANNEGVAVTDNANLDATTPNAPTIEGVGEDSGHSSLDFITNDQTLSFSGQAEANSSIEVFIDNNSIGTTTANAQGAFLIDYTGTTLAEGSYSITAKATDAAGNNSAASTAQIVEIDLTAPTVVITSNANDPQSGAFTATFTFSEDVSGFAEEDITVSNGTASNFNTTSAKVYTATITPLTDGEVTIDVLANKTEDVAGNVNTAAVQLGVTNDETAPAAPVVASISSDTGTSDTDHLTKDQTLEIAGTAEANASIEVFIDGNSVGNTTADGSGDWTFDYTATTLTEATYSITAKSTDAAGNTSAASAALSATIDTTTPNRTAGSIVGKTYGLDQNMDIVVDYNEIVLVETTGGTPSINISMGGQTRTAAYLSGSGTTSLTFRYTTISGDFDGNGVSLSSIQLNGGSITDAAGNNAELNGAYTGEGAVRVDTAIPSLSITSSSNRTSGAFSATFTFSEDVSGFSLNDISVTNGTASNFNTISASVYTATITPSNDGEVTVDVSADAAIDAGGNGNTVATQLSVTNDETAPSVTITTNANDPHSGDFTATFTFSEDVSGFDVNDISVTNGSASNFNTTSARVYSARITPTADGQVTVGVAANKAKDLAGNFNTPATSINVTNDQTAPSLVSVTKDSDTQMTLTFSEPVVPGANAHTGITVYGGNNKFENAVSAPDGTVGDNQIVLTFNSLSALLGDLEVLHSGGSTIADLAGNVYPLDGTGAKVDDTTAPILVSATKDSDTQITLTFSEEVQTLGNNPTDFTVVDDNSINFLVQAITDGTAEDNKLILTVADMSNAQLNLNITYTNNNNEVSDFGGNQLATDATGVNISLNAPPTATAVSFSGTLTVGETLTGAYTYADADNDTETGTTFKWYRSDDINGTNKAAIPGATASTYGLTSTDVDKYISFEVNPNDGKNTGASVESVIQGPISKISQTITFNALNDKTYGDASFDLTATASSNLGLTYTSSNSNVATVSGNTVTIVGAGTTTLTASQSGDASYSAATDATQLLTVNKAVLTATAEDKSKTYGEANPVFTITYSGFVNGDDKTAITTEPIASTTANASTGVGTYDITLSGGAADNYSLITNNGFLTIGKATLTATADDKSKTYGEANPAFTVTYAGFVNGDDKTAITTEPTASTTVNASTGVGTYDITLSGGVADNYSLITNNGFLTISKATLIATADDKSKTYGETNPAFTISYTGFVNGDDRTAISTEPTASTTANASTVVGTYDITLSGGVADNYSLITNNGSLTIGKATLTATADDKSKIYGEANPAFTISYTGFVNGDDKTAITTEPTASTTANASTGAGTYDITLSGGTADNYSLVTNKGSLTIGKATLTATADDKSKIYGEVNPAFTISYTGFVNGDDKTAITTEPTASTMADATSGVGTYDITLSGGAADNYSLLTNNGSLTIGKATLTAKADDKQRAVGQDNPAFTISYSGFVNGDNVSDIDVQPTASTTANVATAAGTAAITLTGGSDNNYDFNLVDGTLTIIEVSFITFVSVPNDGTYAIGDELSFAINFALPVTITGSPTLPLTIGSNTVAASLYGTVADATKATFNYKVEEGDLDTDGIVLGTSIDLNGGTILDGFGENAILTLSNIASTASVKVDGVRAIPTLSSSVGNLTNSTFSVTVTYDEPVSGLTAEDLEITNGTADNVTVLMAGLVWSADITPIADGATTVSVKSGAVADNAGNTSLASNNSITTTFDGTSPTVTSILRAEADQIPTGTTNRNFTVTFSEEVTGVDITDFEIITTASATASINSVSAVDAKTYTVNVNGISGEGTIGLNAKDDNSITDMATNSLAAAFTGEVYTTNFVPTDITLSASSIQENNGVGDEIASLTTVDADAGDSFTYSLVLGTGSADNASFTISGDKLLAAEVYDFELKNSYSIRIKTDDGFGGTFENALTIEITNEGESVIDIAGDGDFDQTALGLSSTKTWTITNDGDAATEVRVISSTEGFSFNPGSVQVGAGESKEITAVFSPTEAKVYNGTVVFNFDITDEMQDNVIEVNLTGEGMIVTGLDNGQINEEQIGVFPNPASNYVTIDLSELNGMPLNIQMISPTGVSTLEKEGYDKSELRIDVANFESGLYIILFSNKSSLVRKKVLVRK